MFFANKKTNHNALDLIANQNNKKQKQLAVQRGEIIHPREVSSRTGIVTWRIFRIMAEFVDGYEFLGKVKRDVTILGSARTKPGSKYYQIAYDLGKLLAKEKYTVVTGGGPGIMEAANKGAYEGKGESLGLNIKLPKEQRSNPYVTSSLGFHFFFTRKVMLTSPSLGFVVFPGGFGSLDEFFEIATLIQTKKMPKAPIVLVGKDYWSSLNHFIQYQVLDNHQAIDKKDMEMYDIVDSAAEAFKLIKQKGIKRGY